MGAIRRMVAFVTSKNVGPAVSVSDTGIVGGKQFPETSWSALLAARDPRSPDYARRLQGLVELYWKPVYTVIRYKWAKSADDAKDLTQEFFVNAVLEGNLLHTFEPERGSFRAFLRRAVNYFMCETTRDGSRIKRGGDLKFVSLDGMEDLVAPHGEQLSNPEQLFDATWNQVVLSRAVALLKARLKGEGREVSFELFERYDLDAERKAVSYADLGQGFGLSSSQVKHALGHARAAFRETVIEVVRDYVDGPENLTRELELLFGR